MAHLAGSAALWLYLAHCLRQAGVPNVPLTLDIPTNADLTALLRQSLHQAMTDPALAPTRAELLIGGFDEVPAAAYGVLQDGERQATALGIVQL